MKTNQNMIRKMGEFDVIQRTSDGYFNATMLLKQWNESTKEDKRMQHYFDNQNTKDYLILLENELNEQSIKSGVSNSRNSCYLTTRGNSGSTWMHPFLFIDWCMWVNPKFKLEVIKFVYDKLIQFRHLAGDNYRPFCSAISMIDSSCDFSEPAKWLNFVVFNTHQRDIRNSANQEQLSALQELEKKYSSLIFEGYITDIQTLKEKLRAEWKKRHAVVPFELVG